MARDTAQFAECLWSTKPWVWSLAPHTTGYGSTWVYMISELRKWRQEDPEFNSLLHRKKKMDEF